MRDEEVRKVRYQMSPRRKTIPIPNYSIKISNRRPQNDHDMSHFHALDYKKTPMNECIPNEEINRQYEAEQLTTPEPGLHPRSIGMNFHMADKLSIDESDNELSDPLPLAY